VALISLCNLGRMQELQGRLHGAKATYRQALRFAAEQGEPPLPVTGLVHVGLGALRLEWNDLPAATRHLQEGLQLGRRLGIVEIQAVGRTILAQVYQAQGEPAGVVEATGEVQHLMQEYPVSAGTAARIAACQARLWIGQADITMWKYLFVFALIMHGLAHVSGPLGFWTSGPQAFAEKPWLFPRGVTPHSALGWAFGLL
jgi:ATP/maltotriose-dependent transcriptional regulator MalT